MFSKFLQITTKNNKSIFIILFILICALGSVLWISQTNPGISIILLLLLGYFSWKSYVKSSAQIKLISVDGDPELNDTKQYSPGTYWKNIINANSIVSESQQHINSLNIENQALIQLIKEPESLEPFLLLLEDIEKFTDAKSSAIFITPGPSSKLILLASTDTDDELLCDAIPHKMIPKEESNGEIGELIELHHAPQNSDFKYACILLNKITHNYSFLILKLSITTELSNTVSLKLKERSERLSNIVSSVQSARLKLRNAQYEERAAIARELHDSLAQSLSYLKIQSSRLQSMLTDSEMQVLSKAMEIDAMMHDVRTTLNVAYRHLRELITTFRLTMGGKDFSQALNDSVEEFSKRSGIAFDIDNRLPENVLTVIEETQLLHIIRESLSNVVRHSQATIALVSIHYSKQGQVTASIEDDGIGLQNITDPEQHFGIIIMQERAHSINGNIRLSERSNGGSRLTIMFQAGNQTDVTSTYI